MNKIVSCTLDVFKMISCSSYMGSTLLQHIHVLDALASNKLYFSLLLNIEIVRRHRRYICLSSDLIAMLFQQISHEVVAPMY